MWGNPPVLALGRRKRRLSRDAGRAGPRAASLPNLTWRPKGRGGGRTGGRKASPRLGWRVPAGERAQGVHCPSPLYLCPDPLCSASWRAGGLMCTLGAGEGAGAVRLGCRWEGPCFARGGKYLATMIPLSAFYYELPQCWGYEAAGDEAGS